ncbi:hypothetical protein BU17DRAFT_52181 [Hysterangium stoloniferum]|nr:hypothetical protein BU17DRAFT_52181 [Hysterangium stoloniferum]
MALQPSLSFLQIIGQASAPHTLEFFLDYVCPFSAKIAKSIENDLKPMISKGGKYDGKVKVIVRLHPQPWHATSTLTHEAALAVGRTVPAAFWLFSLGLFEHQTEYFDIPASTLTALQIRSNLVRLAAPYVGNDRVQQVEELLKLKSTPNGGTGVTDDLKYNVKYSRANSIHVSPTALWNGLIANDVSSSFKAAEWASFLEQRVTA